MPDPWIRFTIALHEDHDRDLITLIEDAENKTRFLRHALRVRFGLAELRDPVDYDRLRDEVFDMVRDGVETALAEMDFSHLTPAQNGKKRPSRAPSNDPNYREDPNDPLVQAMAGYADAFVEAEGGINFTEHDAPTVTAPSVGLDTHKGKPNDASSNDERRSQDV